MYGHPDYPAKRRKKRNEGDIVIPKEVLSAVETVIACGKEVIVRKERGKWVVLENGRRLVYKEE